MTKGDPIDYVPSDAIYDPDLYGIDDEPYEPRPLLNAIQAAAIAGTFGLAFYAAVWWLFT